jgi:type IV pilus assembly protein PilN
LRIEINLIRGRPRRKKIALRLSGFRPGRFLKAPPFLPMIIGGVIVLFMLGVHIYQSHQIAVLDQDIEVALADSTALSTTIEMLKEIRLKRDDILQRIEIVRELDRKRYLFPELMDQVSTSVPDLVWLTKWAPVQPDSGSWFELQGESFSNLRIAELMTRLERSGLIEEVTLINIHEKIEEGISTLVFTLRCRYLDGSNT